MIPKYRIYIKHLQILTYHISSINFAAKTVEVWLTGPDEGDPSEYNFDEIEINEYIGKKDKDDDDIYTNDLVSIYNWGHNQNNDHKFIGTGYIYYDNQYCHYDYEKITGYIPDERDDMRINIKIIGNKYN